MIKRLIPNRLGKNRLPRGIKKASLTAGESYALHALKRLEFGENSFPFEMFPKRSRISAPVLAAHTVHYRNWLYDPDLDLQSLIESRINAYSGTKVLLAINAAASFYAFEVEEFSYGQLDWMKDVTYALEFIVFELDTDKLFVFHEDAPACFISYADQKNFEKDFGSLAAFKEIFCKNDMDWRITKLPGEIEWLHKVESYFGCSDTS